MSALTTSRPHWKSFFAPYWNGSRPKICRFFKDCQVIEIPASVETKLFGIFTPVHVRKSYPLSENIYLGPPSTMFSASPSSAPPPPIFRPFQAFGRNFRPKGAVKIGFFRPGAVEEEDETPGEFFMLRPFDLTGK